MKGLTADIFEIKRFAVHDGDGIRTTVFFKGCPLRCIWCHNPEGLEKSPRLAYFGHKCIGCGLCTTRCEFDAIHLRRDNPECSTMVASEDKLKKIFPNAAKMLVRRKVRA